MISLGAKLLFATSVSEELDNGAYHGCMALDSCEWCGLIDHTEHSDDYSELHEWAVRAFPELDIELDHKAENEENKTWCRVILNWQKR